MKDPGFMLVFFAIILLWAYPVSIFVHADDSSMPLVKDSLPEDVPDSGSGSGSGSVSGSESSDHSEEDHSGERHVVETKTKTETQQQTTKTTSTSTPIIAPISTPSVYDYTVKDIDGNDVCLSKYRGRVLIIVNYADSCYYTKSNTEKLSEWAKKYGKDGLTVLVFPCNSFLENFGGNSVSKRLDSDYPELEVFSPVIVNGFYGVDPLYVYLKNSLANQATLVTTIKWNFTKFLVDRNGQPVNRYSPIEDFGVIESRINELILESP